MVRLQNIGNGSYNPAPAHISQSHFESLQKHAVEPGDLLVASLGEALPRACLAPPDLGPAIVKADCIRIRLGSDVDPRFVMYALQRPEARHWASEQVHGVGRPRLGLKLIREIPVPIPPLEEQRRIVDILEDHLSRIDAGTGVLAISQERVQRLHDAAVVHSPAIQTADRIALERLLGAPLINGKSVPTADDGFPVLRLTSLGAAWIDQRERKIGAWTEADAKRFRVSTGDFLVSRGNGSLSLVARGGIVGEVATPVAFPDTMIRVRVGEAIPDVRYLAAIWNSRIVRRQIESAARTTAGIYKVNQGQLRGIELPVPSPDEQQDLISRLGAVQEAEQTLVRELGRARQRASSLRRALLAAAFSGRLTGRLSDLELTEEMADA
ncbi:restriction endonuclease subunit S [Cellulomonas fengjieae]|uniref:restriction endonuclease subunit S n=1 Tax=Cellulomonas fengjieae TaxID=2819978 RepID=UPI001AAF04F8|nr:restriction endonuclease subunit S [Cellulomonas fengjieae]MBO3102578.1 restriction endonuclease subunit S [Cellulomonas fengjieae]